MARMLWSGRSCLSQVVNVVRLKLIGGLMLNWEN